MSDLPSSPPPANQGLRYAPAPHHISFTSSSNNSTPSENPPTTPRLAPGQSELSASVRPSPRGPSGTGGTAPTGASPSTNNEQGQQKKYDRLIPIYVRLVPRDLWLRFHIDQRSTIGALKDIVLDKVGASSHDPSLSPFFYEEAGRSESLSLAEGVAVPSLPRTFQAKKPKPPPAHHANQRSLSGSSNQGSNPSNLANVSRSSRNPPSPFQSGGAPKSPKSRMSGLSSLAPLGFALSSSSGSSSAGVDSRKSSLTTQDQLIPEAEFSSNPDPLHREDDPQSFQQGIEASSSAIPLSMPSSPPSRAMWEQRRKSKDQDDGEKQPPSSPSSVTRSKSTRTTPSSTALGKRAVSTVLEETASISPSASSHSPSLSLDLGSSIAGTGALRGNEEALRLEKEALDAFFSRKSVSVPRSSEISNNNHNTIPKSPPLSPTMDTTPVLPSTSASSSPRPPQSFKSPARRPPISSANTARPTRTKPRNPLVDQEFDSDDLIEDSTSDDESETRYSLNDDWSESGRDSRASMVSPEPEFESPRKSTTILTTTDGERLWGTQLEEALKMNSSNRDGERERTRGLVGLRIQEDGSGDEEDDEAEARLYAADLEGSSSSSAAAAAARRRSGTITMAGRSGPSSTLSRPESLDEIERELDPGGGVLRGSGSRGEMSDGGASIAKGSSTLSSSSSRRGVLSTMPSNLTDSSLMSNPVRNGSQASFGSSNGKNEALPRDLTPSTSLSASLPKPGSQSQTKPKVSLATSAWADSSNSPSAKRLAGINPDEISVWRNASHGLSRFYSVYSFANGHLMEDWRTVAAFRIRPFELFEIQYSNPAERAYLPRSSNVSVGSGRQSAGEIGIDEKYGEPFSEGWYYVHKPGSGPSKMRKAGIGVWKLRWITVRGWKLTVHRKQPPKGDLSFASSSSSPTWHLGTIKWISSEPAEIPVKPLLPSSEPLAPETLYIAFSTSGNMLPSAVGGTGMESQSLALRCITPMDHEAMFRLLTRAHYRYSVARIDSNQSLEIESWRRKAIARAIISGRGGTVVPGRAGRKNGRNSLSRTRLRPSGVSRDWDDADRWSSQSEEESILPKSLSLGDGFGGTGAISRAVEASRKEEEAKRRERERSGRGNGPSSSLLLSANSDDPESDLPRTPSATITPNPHTPPPPAQSSSRTSTSQTLVPNETIQSSVSTSPSSTRSRGFSLSRSNRKGGESSNNYESPNSNFISESMSRSMSGDSFRAPSGGEEDSFSSNQPSSTGRSWRTLARPGSSTGSRSRSFTIGTIRPSTSGGQ